MIVTVMGASGQIGRRVAEQLLQAGVGVRAIGRSQDKLGPLWDAGAEAWVGDSSNPEFLTRAFRGADAVHSVLPYEPGVPDYRAAQAAIGSAVARAAVHADIRRLLFVSSIGAEQPSRTGVLGSLRAQEERLRGLPGIDVLVLRAGAFFENFLAQIELIRYEGIVAEGVSPQRLLPMIATRDVADAAVAALRAGDWGHFEVRELLGQRDLSHAEATRILGDHIGRPALRYVQLSRAELEQALVQAGCSPGFAQAQAELSQAIDEGRIHSLEGRHARNTTPTRFEDFAVEFARAYRAAGAEEHAA